jgi:transposase
MASEFWFSDEQWAKIEPLLPKNRSGAHRVDDRRVISGIVHVLKSGCRWQDCPAGYGPPTTSTIASGAGRCRGSGAGFSWRWWRSPQARRN